MPLDIRRDISVTSKNVAERWQKKLGSGFHSDWRIIVCSKGYDKCTCLFAQLEVADRLQNVVRRFKTWSKVRYIGTTKVLKFCKVHQNMQMLLTSHEYRVHQKWMKWTVIYLYDWRLASSIFILVIFLLHPIVLVLQTRILLVKESSCTK